MSEFCPLNSAEADSGDILWDTGIPYECRQCLNAAYSDDSIAKEASSIDVEQYRDDFGDDYDFELADKWLCTGIKRVNDKERLGIEETGIDNSGENAEYPTSRTNFRFICDKAKQD